MPRFGELEAAIMDCLWSADGPLPVRDVVAELRRDREIAFTTVQTVLEILYRKGWLERAREGRAYRYRPTAPREDYTAQLVEEALATTTDRAAALARYVERMDSAEVRELRAAIDAARVERQ